MPHLQKEILPLQVPDVEITFANSMMVWAKVIISKPKRGRGGLPAVEKQTHREGFFVAIKTQ